GRSRPEQATYKRDPWVEQGNGLQSQADRQVPNLRNTTFLVASRRVAVAITGRPATSLAGGAPCVETFPLHPAPRVAGERDRPGAAYVGSRSCAIRRAPTEDRTARCSPACRAVRSSSFSRGRSRSWPASQARRLDGWDRNCRGCLSPRW